LIYVVGDRHGEEDGFSDDKLPEQSSWMSDDIVIVTGDFGYVMRGEKNNLPERNKLDALAQKPYMILFCDGNHEGFDYLEQYPEEIRFGAPIRKIRHNIYWLQRGYIYTIEKHTFLVMGGAYSTDKAFRLKYQATYGERIWFPQELPTAEEYQRAIRNLKEHNNKVDYIVTHTAPRTIIPRITGSAPALGDLELTGFFDWIYHEIQFTQWFFGHFHEDKTINSQITACFHLTHLISS
jgi:predicted phosphohydrolase